MRLTGCLLILTFGIASLLVTAAPDRSPYDPAPDQPFGRPNPEAAPEFSQFRFLIGRNDCVERTRAPQGGEWLQRERRWDAFYTMNGNAIMDTGVSATGANGNVRIFDASEGLWKVTFFSTPGYGSGVWRGGMEGDAMVLRQPQKAPGTELDGFSTLTFSDISKDSFEWRGEWISADGSVVYPFWTISCRKI